MNREKYTIEDANNGLVPDNAFSADQGKKYLEDFYKEIELVSNCCGAEVINHDERGQGRCSDCGENCEEVEVE